MKLFRKDEIGYVQLYKKIKKRCQFQLNFSSFLLVVFFILQYSVPICLVVLGSGVSSEKQLVSVVSSVFSLFSSSQITNPEQKQSGDQSSEQKQIDEKKIEGLVSQIIFLLGIVTILLGVINNTIRPAESYDTCSNYNNEFNKFLIDLDLDIIKLGGLSEKLPPNSQEVETKKAKPQEVETQKTETPKVDLIYQLLIAKNDELFKLIDRYNKARSLTPRQANMEAITQKDDEPSSKNTSSASSGASEDNKGNSLADSPNAFNESSDNTPNKSVVKTPNTSN